MIDTKAKDASKTVKAKKDKNYRKIHIDFNQAVSNNLLSLETAASYLNSKIKVNGLTGNLGDSVKVSPTDKKDKQKNTIVVQVHDKMQFSKRYVKYLVKKFLKKEGISAFLRVISTGSNGYQVKMFQRNVE